MKTNSENVSDTSGEFSFNNMIPGEILLKDKLKTRLSSLDFTLTGFNDNSEKTFLDIGSKLQTYYSVAQKIASKASEASSTISEKILKKGISELSGLMEIIREYLELTSEEILRDNDIIKKTQTELVKIDDGISGFDKIVKRLRMLGISTKIESARLSTDNTDFFSLAENVDELSGIIHEKSIVIKRKSGLLTNELIRTVATLELLSEEQDKQSKTVMNSTRHSLESLKEKYNEGYSKTDRISQKSTGLTRNISDVVASIQFHDITRQQIEHVKDAFNEIILKISEVDSNDNDKLSGSLSFAHDVCELQSIQLKNALDELTKAVFTIITNLQGIEHNVSEILDESFELICDNDNVKLSCLDIIEKELAEVSNGLLENINISNDFYKSIQSVVDVLDDLGNYVIEIENIGSEIELISLNARIKAAHAGDDGAALGVLAEAIQKLSQEAKTQTEISSDIIRNVNTEADKLRVKLESDTVNNDNHNIDATISSINSLIKEMVIIESESENKISKLKDDVRDLQRQINNTISGINIHQHANDVLQSVVDELNDSINEIKSTVDIQSFRQHNTKELLHRYTMHSERKIHHDYSGDDLSGNSGHQSHSDNSETDPFGDNVELF